MEKGEISVGNRLRKLKTSLLAIPLALGMLGLGLALPQTSLVANATGTGTMTNDNGGTSSGGLAGSSSLSTAWNNSEQGYRFYIVDQGYNCVSTVHDYVYTTPTGVSKVLFATRGKPWNSGSAPTMGNFTSLQAECQASTPPNPPYLGNGRAGGSEFRAWFLGGAAGILVHGSSTAPWTSDIYMSYQNSQITARRQGGGGTGGPGGGGGGSTGGVWREPRGVHTPCVCSKISAWASVTPPSCATTSDVMLLSASEIAQAISLSRTCASAATTAENIYNCGRYSICISNLSKDALKNRAAASGLGRNTDNYVGRVAYSVYAGVFSEAYLNGVKTNKQAAGNSRSGSGGSGGSRADAGDIPKRMNTYSAAQIPTASGESPAYNYLSKEGFWNVPGFDSGLNALMELDGAGNNLYYLVVEPITWVAVANGSGVAVAPGKVYGTIYDILAYYASNYPAIGNGYYPAIFAYMINSMTILQEYPGLLMNGHPQQMASGSIGKGAGTPASYVAQFLSGWGFGGHIYTSLGGDFQTSTCDEPVAPDNPHKPPKDHLNPPDGGTPPVESDIPPDKVAYSIVKFYVEYDYGVGGTGGASATVKSRSNFITKNEPPKITIEEEEQYNGYKLTDWFSSPVEREPGGGDDYYEFKGSLPNVVTGTSPSTITLKKNVEKTLYVLLVKSESDDEPTTSSIEADWHLKESQLTKRVDTNINNPKTLDLHEFKVKWGELPNCDGHPVLSLHEWDEEQTYTCDGDGTCGDESHVDGVTGEHSSGTEHKSEWQSTGETAYCEQGDYDKELIFELKQTNTSTKARVVDFGDKLTQVSDSHFERNGSPWTDEGEKILKGYNYEFVIHRAAKDKPYQYNFKSQIPELEGVGFQSYGGQLTNRTNGTAQTDITLTFEPADSVDKETSIHWNEPNLGDNKRLDGLPCGMSTDIADIPRALPLLGKITMEVWAGTMDGGKVNKACNSDYVYNLGAFGGSYSQVSGKMVPSGSEFAFLPYIQMRYDTMTQKDIDVYMLSIWERQVTPNDYAELAWSKSGTGNLHVTSQQWSVHASAIGLGSKKYDWQGTNQVLPGGAIYSLDTQGSNQKMMVNTYQTIVTGAGRMQAEQLYPIDGLDEISAKEAHDAYVETVVDGLEQLHVEQYADKNTGCSNAWDNGIVVEPDADLGDLHGLSYGSNAKASPADEEKYYFREDTEGGQGTGSNEGDYDVRIVGTTEDLYTFSSDTKGNILMNGTVILTKNQGISSLSNATAKALDARTLVVTKFVESIERNTGNDSEAGWVSDGHWYNEAFDGVSVLVQRTELEIGFAQPSVRSTVLDPKLTPANSGQSDLYSKAYATQFKTQEASKAYGEKDVLGTFKGQTIKTKNLDMLFWSNKFYIPNVNVQDLK